MPNKSEPSVFTKSLLAAALELGAAVEDGPATWTGSQFNSEALAREDSGRAVRDRSDEMLAIVIDSIPVLIGELHGSCKAIEAAGAIRAFRNQATIARSWLGIEAQNLQLFVVGPPGSESDHQWIDLAEAIEADDRVCRKIVWLPPASPTAMSALRFLKRTFLARPWTGLAAEPVQRLDRLSFVDIPDEWKALLQTPDLEPELLIARLIEATP
jgi:hypothetical protein